MNYKKEVLEYLEENKDRFYSIAEYIWRNPEIGLQEYKSSSKLILELEKEGFNIKRNISGMETAFIGEWGTGKPIIGVLGEYDALPGLSQKVSVKKEPIIQGEPGHGCGHNLIGSGSLAAIISVKKIMEKNNIKGTLKYYGCPAEETTSSKVLMVKNGVFDDLDASLIWHPDFANATYYSSTLAMNSFKVNFHGITAHAAGDPEAGRSALDAAILMDVGVNYLREHIIQEARIHSYISNGGTAPNIVPEYSQIHYIIRAPKRKDVDDIYTRMISIAKGATLMTETNYDIEFVSGTYNYLVNNTINDAISENFDYIGEIKYTEEEKNFAYDLVHSNTQKKIDRFLENHELKLDDFSGYLCARIANELNLKGFSKGETVPVSGDRADVAYITPSAQFGTTCVPLGIAEHTWQFVSSCGSSIGNKGMILAAKVMALTALDLIINEKLLENAKKELEIKKEGREYVSPLIN